MDFNKPQNNALIIEHLQALREIFQSEGGDACPLRLSDDLRARLAGGGSADWQAIAAWMGNSGTGAENAVCAVLGLTFAVRSEIPIYLASSILREAPRVMMRIPLALAIDHNLEQQVEVEPLPAACVEEFAQRADYLAQKIDSLGFRDRIESFLSVWSPIDAMEKRARAAAREHLARMRLAQEESGGPGRVDVGNRQG